MPAFTAFDPATRLILYSGKTAVVALLPHDAFEGFEADPETERVNAALSGVEPKPALGASVEPLSISAGESVTVTVPEPCTVVVDGSGVGEIAFTDTIEFPDPGTYRVRLEAVSRLVLAEQFTVTVT